MTVCEYTHIEINESGDPLVNLADYNFVLEPFYFNTGHSSTPEMYLRKGIVEKLLKIQADLQPLRLKIWDGWRSRDVQHSIYKMYRNDLARQHPDWSKEKLQVRAATFVTVATDPNRIPPHATGGSVDLTLVDADGRELDMGTGFDYFGPEAASLYYEENNANPIICQNRRTLRNVMVHAGFRFDDDEWWHFDFGNQLWAATLNKPFAFYGEIDP